MKKVMRQLSNSRPAFDLYIPVAIESARSARIAYIAFLVLGFTLIVTLLQVDHIGLLLTRPIILPVINREVPISLYLIAGPVLLFLAYLGVMLRIVTVRRVVTACLSILMEPFVRYNFEDELKIPYLHLIQLSHFLHCRLV